MYTAPSHWPKWEFAHLSKGRSRKDVGFLFYNFIVGVIQVTTNVARQKRYIRYLFLCFHDEFQEKINLVYVFNYIKYPQQRYRDFKCD